MSVRLLVFSDACCLFKRDPTLLLQEIGWSWDQGITKLRAYGTMLKKNSKRWKFIVFFGMEAEFCCWIKNTWKTFICISLLHRFGEQPQRVLYWFYNQPPMVPIRAFFILLFTKNERVIFFLMSVKVFILHNCWRHASMLRCEKWENESKGARPMMMILIRWAWTSLNTTKIKQLFEP